MDILKKALGSLPQRDHINPDDLKNWLKTAQESDPKRIVWHINRTRGVGGSEIGTLLLEAQGLTPPFGRTGQSLAAEKLFKSPPSPPLPHMMRGIILEKPMIEAMLNIYGGTRDLQAEMAIKLPNPASPGSMEGNPDLYWNIENKRILVDTKVPFDATEEGCQGSENHKLFTYKAQVNHYDILGSARGYPADKLVIAELDVPVELADTWMTLVRKGNEKSYKQVVDQMTVLLGTQKPGMRINFIEVEPELSVNLYGKDTPIKEAIRQVSDDFMGHLVRGESMDAYTPEVIEPDQETINEIQEIDQRMGALRAMAEYAESEISATQQYLSEKISKDRIDTKGVTTNLFKIDAKPIFDVNSAVSTLSRYPIDLVELHKEKNHESCTSRDLDTKKAIRLLHDHGLLKQCLKPEFEEEKIKQALTSVGELPSTFESQKISFRKSITKASKARFKELNHFVDGIEEHIALRELNQRHAENFKAADSQSVKSDAEAKPTLMAM